MGAVGVLFVGRSPADMTADDNQCWAIGSPPENLKCLRECCLIVRIGNVHHVPAIRFEAGGYIFTEGERGMALDRDAVAVIDPTEFGKPQVARQAGGLTRNPLHHAAVTTQRIDIKID